MSDGLILCDIMSNLVKEFSESLFTDTGKDIDSKGQFYLNKFLSDRYYEKLFEYVNGCRGKIFILNKGRCGNGGTTGFIEYARKTGRNLIISVPNRSIVISKEREKGIGVSYGGSESDISDKNIKVCTWDKTEEVSWVNFGMELIELDEFLSDDFKSWEKPLLIVDEYHKLVDDSNYRDICNEITMKIITTNCNVVLMSATPNVEFVEFLRLFSGKEVVSDNVEYDDKGDDKSLTPLQWFNRPESCRTYDIICDQCDKSRKRKEDYEANNCKVGYKDSKLAIFFNSVKEICNIVKQIPDEFKEDIEVLCAKTELHETTVPCYSNAYDGTKQIHFMTKAYIVGMDIPDKFWRVLFIGGNDAHFKAFSNKEVKQGLGRFRKGYVSTAFVSNGKVKSKFGYAHMKSKIETLEGDIEKRKKYASDSKYVEDHLEDIVKEFLDLLYYKSTVEAMDGWDDFKAFEKMMSEYEEYTLEECKIPALKEYPKARDIAFKKYKEKRLAGVKLPYKHAPICELFIEKFSLEEFAKSTLSEIERRMNMHYKVGDTDVDELTQFELYEFFLGDDFHYSGELMDVLDCLGKAPVKLNDEGKYVKDYSMLEERINEVFGCFCIYQSGNRTKRDCLFLTVLAGEYGGGSRISKTHSYIYRGVGQKNCSDHPSFIKVSKKISPPNKTTVAITDYLDSTRLVSLLEDRLFTKDDIEGDPEKAFEYQKELFTSILDDPSIVSSLKRDPERTKLFERFKSRQTMISEFYKDTPNIKVKYGHRKEDMEKIDSLIVDIDNSISFSKFKEDFSHLEWTAYPSISNADADDWTKFRVIFRLAHTLSLPNDSLSILKLLRRMVCKYEDSNHGLGSYINSEQWGMRVYNEGEVVDISQSTVNYFEALTRNLNIVCRKKRKSKKDGVDINLSELTDAAIERAVKLITTAEKGCRHTTINGQMWKLMTIYHITDEQVEYIRQQITEYEKIQDFNTIVRELSRKCV